MSVAIVKYNGTPDALRRAVELCDGLRDLKSSDRILLKPNILWGSRYSTKAPKFGFVTTSRITEDLIRLPRDHGCLDIFIGEGTIANKEVGSHTFRGYAWTGIAKVARKYGVKLIDFNEGPFTTIKLDDLRGLLERSSIIEQRGFLKSFVDKIEVGDSEVNMYYTIPMPPSSLPEETVGVIPFAHHG
jgi:uncharacterized protein (DUF362 family)